MHQKRWQSKYRRMMKMVTQQPVNTENSTVVQGQSLGKPALVQLMPRTTVARDARSDMLKSLAQIRPMFAREIETADAANRPELNEEAEELVKELAIVNQEWGQTIKEYNEAICGMAEDAYKAERFSLWRETQWLAEGDKTRRMVELRTFAPEVADVEEKMDEVMKRRHILSTKLRLIQERKDAPLFARMMCAADLIRWNIHTLAAEILLDLIEIASKDNKLPMEKENNRAEWFLRKIASVHRLRWLDELIEVKPPEVASYRKLRATMLLASMKEPYSDGELGMTPST